MTKRLIRFRLCPSNSCSSSKAGGCSSDYGDYVVDLNSFMDAYFEVTRKATEYDCQYYLANNCNCGNDDGDEETCQYDCLADAGLADSCADRNPYNDDEQQDEQFEADRYMECAQYEIQKNDDGANDNGDEADDGDEAAYYIGPYCAQSGNAVLLGLFTDDTCTSFADSAGGAQTFEKLTGDALPYSSVSLVSSSCVSCYDKEQGDNDDNDGNGALSESCENLYYTAGKCEEHLPSGTAGQPNTDACKYIGGVKTVLNDGIVRTVKSKKSGVATFFTVVLILIAIGLVAYINYLRKRLAHKNSNQSLLAAEP